MVETVYVRTANGTTNDHWFIDDVAADGRYVLSCVDLSSLVDSCYQTGRTLLHHAVESVWRL